MSLLHVFEAIISRSTEDTQVSQEPKIMEPTSNEETPPQDIPRACDQLLGFTDMGGFGNINKFWLP